MQITGKIVCTAADEHREEAKELASRLDIPFAAADAFSEDCDEILQTFHGPRRDAAAVRSDKASAETPL